MPLQQVEEARNCCWPAMAVSGEVTASVYWHLEEVITNGTLDARSGGGEGEREGGQMSSAVLVINTISIILGVLSILLNIAFLFTTRFMKESATAYNRFMINLSVSDVMSSLTFLLIHTWPKGPFNNDYLQHDFYLVHALPYLFRSTPWMFLTSYLLTLTCLTVNQYVAVCKPWRYSALVTPRAVNASLLVVWLVSSLQVLIPLAVLLVLNCLPDKHQAINRLLVISMIEMQVWMALYALSSVFNICLNLVIYRRIRMLKLKRRGSHVSNPEMANIKMKQEAFVTVTLLLLVCFFCRLPFPLMGIVGISMVMEQIDVTAYTTVNAAMVLLLYVNCFADPIIYMTRTHGLRRTYRQIWARCAGMGPCCCSPGSPPALSCSRSAPLASTQHLDGSRNGRGGGGGGGGGGCGGGAKQNGNSTVLEMELSILDTHAEPVEL